MLVNTWGAVCTRAINLFICPTMDRTRAAAAVTQTTTSQSKMASKLLMKAPRVLPPKFQPSASAKESAVQPPTSPNNLQPLIKALPASQPPSPSKITRLKPMTKNHVPDNSLEKQKENRQDDGTALPTRSTQHAAELVQPFDMKSLAVALPLVRPGAFDIGSYDGGLEDEDDQPNKHVTITPEAEKLLRLGSSLG